MKQFVVVDLDGTLCDINHRVHLAQAKLWDEFNELCTDDKLVTDISSLVHSLEDAGHPILICTGRSDKYINQTLEWLAEQNHSPDVLLMRPADEYDSDVNIKIKMLERHFGNKESVLQRVLCVIDDRDKVVQALRDYGLTVLQCREGDY